MSLVKYSGSVGPLGPQFPERRAEDLLVASDRPVERVDLLDLGSRPAELARLVEDTADRPRERRVVAG